jgi:uncharacterized protein (TIGR03118 family)
MALEPCPLKSFCDPFISYTGNPQPIVTPCGPRKAVTTWKVKFLVSNINDLATNYDPDLIDPWGLVIFNNRLWVVSDGSDIISVYDLYGNRQGTFIDLRDNYQNVSFATGLIVNSDTGFPVTNGLVTRPALFLTATEHGEVLAYNPFVDPGKTYVVLNQQITGEIMEYRGLAIANNTLYLADFFRGRIDVFDNNYNRLLGFNFIDNDLSDPIPVDFAPNNIVHIGCNLFVLYARRDPNVPLEEIHGPGNGYISVFNYDGSFVRRFTSRGVLNSPWAMIPAPCECGFPPGSFLVGNTGDGRINVFDYNGRYVGPLLNQAGLPIVIEGLCCLEPHYCDFSHIFFYSLP